MSDVEDSEYLDDVFGNLIEQKQPEMQSGEQNCPNTDNLVRKQSSHDFSFATHSPCKEQSVESLEESNELNDASFSFQGQI